MNVSRREEQELRTIDRRIKMGALVHMGRELLTWPFRRFASLFSCDLEMKFPPT